MEINHHARYSAGADDSGAHSKRIQEEIEAIDNAEAHVRDEEDFEGDDESQAIEEIEDEALAAEEIQAAYDEAEAPGQEDTDDDSFTSERRQIYNEGAQVWRNPRDERAHADRLVGEARQEVPSEPKERQGRENAQRVRRPRDQLAALISALAEIAGVIDGRRRWCVIEANCLDILPSLPARLVDHVITDPPYSKAVHARSIRRTYLPDVAEQPCRKTRKHDFGFKHVTREDVSVYAREFRRLADRWILTFSDMETSEWWRADFGDTYVRMGVWVKDRAMPQISGDRPSSRCEHIVVAHRAGRKHWNGGGRGNIWQHPVVANCNGHRQDRIHTAQKPESLMLELVSLFTDEDDVILDPFCGSATTGLACLRLHRRFIGIDLSPTLSHQRLLAEQNNSSLQASLAGQRPLFE